MKLFICCLLRIDGSSSRALISFSTSSNPTEIDFILILLFRGTIESELNKGTHIVMDRYAYSGAAFTSAKGLDLEWCKNGDRGLPQPDIVFFLEASEDQIATRGDFGKERYEKKEFQKLVKENYLKLMEFDEKQGLSIWKRINAGADIDKVKEDLLQAVQEKVDLCNKGQLGPLQRLWTYK